MRPSDDEVIRTGIAAGAILGVLACSVWLAGALLGLTALTRALGHQWPLTTSSDLLQVYEFTTAACAVVFGIIFVGAACFRRRWVYVSGGAWVAAVIAVLGGVVWEDRTLPVMVWSFSLCAATVLLARGAIGRIPEPQANER